MHTDTDKLALDHQRLESLVNSMSDGVIATDADCRIALYNGAALNLLDSNKIAKGDPLESILQLRNADGEAVDTKNTILATKRQTISRDYTVAYADGSIVHIYLSIAPVKQGYGVKNEGGFVLIMRDITREKSLEEERDEFISVVSHELRTPVAAIEGSVGNALYLTEKGIDRSTIIESLKNAHEQSLYLEDLINDLTTLARAERSNRNSSSPIDIHALTEELLSIYSKSAHEKGLTMQAHLDPDIGQLHSVELYVREILQNFITNAIKYTDEGTVTITASKTTDGVQFTVADTGIGISKSDQAKVFDKFFRSEDLLTRKQSGTGLGLHVTKKLAQMTNATMSIESKLGTGTTFNVTFPHMQ